jgi:hypothetical protein
LRERRFIPLDNSNPISLNKHRPHFPTPRFDRLAMEFGEVKFSVPINAEQNSGQNCGNVVSQEGIVPAKARPKAEAGVTESFLAKPTVARESDASVEGPPSPLRGFGGQPSQWRASRSSRHAGKRERRLVSQEGIVPAGAGQRTAPRGWVVPGETSASEASSGEPGRNRTFNPQIKSLLLCQLSYWPTSGEMRTEDFRRASTKSDSTSRFSRIASC